MYDQSDRANQDQWADRADLQAAIDLADRQHLTAVLADKGIAWTIRAIVDILAPTTGDPIALILAELSLIAGGDRVR